MATDADEGPLGAGSRRVVRLLSKIGCLENDHAFRMRARGNEVLRQNGRRGWSLGHFAVRADFQDVQSITVREAIVLSGLVIQHKKEFPCRVQFQLEWSRIVNHRAARRRSWARKKTLGSIQIKLLYLDWL